MKIIASLAALSVLVAVTPVLAAGPINARQINQERLIDAGFRSGKLTRSEVTMLKNDQRSIRFLEDRMRARHGGKLIRTDKRILQQRQDRADVNIAREKADHQRGRNRLDI